jgi:acid phosphatase (class A)
MRIAVMLLSVSAVLVSTTHAAEPPATTPSTMTPETRLSGYLPASEMLSSGALVPLPPVTDSAEMARDQEGNRRALELQGTPRWTIASQDAVLSFPAVAETFACALNAPISDERTPRLMKLLRRTLVDAGRSTSEAKKRYQRPRPFMVNGKPICTPTREDVLRADGSYPSGHAAIGWAFGLVLAEVAPKQSQSLIARGRAFGLSRVVCNVHWPSDVLEGQMMASAVVARLHAEAEFRNDLDAARAEIIALQSQPVSAPRDCKLEAQTLASVQ